MPTLQKNTHNPVLLQEVLDVLHPKKGDLYLDLTAGYGGHASQIVSITEAKATLVDRDENAIASLREHFTENQAELVHSDFVSAAKQLLNEHRSYDLILADLGVSSPHLDIASRGFSIQKDGPLDMRMDQRQQVTAADIVNDASESELIRILKEYGEEPKAKRIAKLICEHRPITSTTQLAEVVSRAWPGYSRVHPATRTFQAMRIAVNEELKQVAEMLPLAHKLLSSGGKLAIISFHSLEDALVKRYFNEHGGNRYDANLRILTKKPITASPHEIVFNPRSRSARLRAAERK